MSHDAYLQVDGFQERISKGPQGEHEEGFSEWLRQRDQQEMATLLLKSPLDLGARIALNLPGFFHVTARIRSWSLVRQQGCFGSQSGSREQKTRPCGNGFFPDGILSSSTKRNTYWHIGSGIL